MFIFEQSELALCLLLHVNKRSVLEVVFVCGNFGTFDTDGTKKQNKNDDSVCTIENIQSRRNYAV